MLNLNRTIYIYITVNKTIFKCSFVELMHTTKCIRSNIYLSFLVDKTLCTKIFKKFDTFIQTFGFLKFSFLSKIKLLLGFDLKMIV